MRNTILAILLFLFQMGKLCAGWCYGNGLRVRHRWAALAWCQRGS